MAQSSVQIYGILDAGVTQISNAGGSAQTLLDTGVMQGNRLGFKGVEDLGGGLKSFFQLETGYSLATGVTGQSGVFWGRKAWVGLTQQGVGTLTIGRQYDFMFDSLGAFNHATLSTGGYGNTPLDNDRVSGQRLNNAVKFVTADVAGFKIGAEYGFADNTTPSTAAHTSSFGANYANGSLNLGAAYTYIGKGSLAITQLVPGSVTTNIGGQAAKIMGIGGTYDLTQTVTVNAMFTRSEFDGVSAASSGTFFNYLAGIAWQATPAWRYGFGYTYTAFRGGSLQQGNLTADYFLSKRTDVYAQVIDQWAGGTAQRADIISLNGSTTQNQWLVRVGMRHTF